ncbi:MAG: hypothetical protein R3Y26_05450 [Rikenellaceae bacterium]
MSVKIEKLAEFEKDIKQFGKKYKTLSEDIAIVERVISVEPSAHPPFSFQIDNLGIETCVIKVRKIASKSFKGRGVMSGFRLIYAHFEAEDRVVFIELYHKNSKSVEDRERIKANFK